MDLGDPGSGAAWRSLRQARRVRPLVCAALSGSVAMAAWLTCSLVFRSVSLTHVSPEAIAMVRNSTPVPPGGQRCWWRCRMGSAPSPAGRVLSPPIREDSGAPGRPALCAQVAESSLPGCGSVSTPGRGSACCRRTGLWWRFGEQQRRPAAGTKHPALPPRGRGAAAGAGPQSPSPAGRAPSPP